MSDCDCNCSCCSYEICHNGCCCSCENICELDCIIANLKNELFEKQQNVRDYCSLQAKYVQLQNDLKDLCDEKKCLECQLCVSEDQGNKLICNLKAENVDLKNKLSEKNCVNKKLYGDNNNLFQVLEGKTNDNQNLQDKLCLQENVLQRLNQEKANLQNTVLNLNQLKEKHMKDIQNLNTQICLLNKNSDDLDNSLRNKNCQNIKIINEFNDAKNLNNGLANELKNKECALMQIQKELCLANETLSRLEKDLDNLNLSHNRNKEQIACFNSNYVKENSLNNQLTNDNTKLNNAINDRNVTIQKLNSENNALKCDNTNTNRDNKFLNSKIEAYKKHILTLTNQNEKLSAELEAIISRDSQLLFTLGRDSHLRAVQQENKNVINSSLDCLQAYTQCKNYNGNAGYSPKSNYGVNVNRSSSLHNSRIDVGDGSGEEQQYSGGEDGQYSGGEEEMQYSGGEEGYGQSSGDENQ